MSCRGKLFLSLIILVLFFGVGTTVQGQAKWTFMVYLDGDNNLEGAGLLDFLEMAKVGSTADVNIVVQFDRIAGEAAEYGDWTGTKRFLVEKDMTPEADKAVTDLGELNMGDPQVLKDFITWAKTNYPAENYALVLWNHGGGWRTASFAPVIPPHRAICWDDTDGEDCLYMKEVQLALTQAGGVTLLGFDACSMGMIEVACEVSGQVGVMVGSQELEPGTGWPYDTVLTYLTGAPTASAADLGGAIVDRYIQSQTAGDVTMSAIDLSKVSALCTAVGTFGDTVQAQWNGGDKGAINSAADAVMSAVTGAVIAEGHKTGHPKAHGLSIYLPQGASWFDSDYKGTVIDFARDYSWDEFLNAYLSTMSGSWVADCRTKAEVFDYGFENVDLYDFAQKVRSCLFAVNDTASTREETPVTIDVLTNDPNPASVTVTVSGVSGLHYGSVVINADNTLTYTPQMGFIGTEIFTYTIRDGEGNTGSATVAVSVASGNAPPVAVNDAVVTDEGVSLDVSVLDNDSDPDGDPLTVTGVSKGSHGTVRLLPNGLIRYTPDNLFNGTDSFSYTICDPPGARAVGKVIVTVRPVPNSPNIVILTPRSGEEFGLGASVTIVAEATDDGTVTKVDFYRGSTLLGSDESYPYTWKLPNPAIGEYAISAEATDDEGLSTRSAVVRFTVVPPVCRARLTLTEPADETVCCEGEDFILKAELIDADSTMDEVEFYAGETRLGSSASRPYQFTWENVPAGSYVLTARTRNTYGHVVWSGGVIVVVNGLPRALDDEAVTQANTPVEIDLLANDSDAESKTLLVEQVEQGSNGNVKLLAGGKVVYTPDPSFQGEDSFSYTVRDSYGARFSATVRVTVQAKPRAPTVRIVRPVCESCFPAGKDIAFCAEASDDGDIACVEFYQGDTLLGRAGRRPYEFIWKQAPAGVYTVTAKAIDGEGESAKSTAVHVRVQKSGSVDPDPVDPDPSDDPQDQKPGDDDQPGDGDEVPGGCLPFALVIFSGLLAGFTLVSGHEDGGSLKRVCEKGVKGGKG